MNWLKQRRGLILIVAIAALTAYLSYQNWQLGNERAAAAAEATRVANERWKLESFTPSTAISQTPTASTPTKTELESDFRQAGIDGDITTLKSLLSQGVNINTVDDKGWTALRGAVFGENIAAVKFLLKNKADPNIQLKDDGTTSLLWAVDNEDIEIVKALLDAGANPNIPDTFTKRTPLMSAADTENYMLTELLLKHGADITITDKYGENVLLQVGERLEDEGHAKTPKFLRTMSLLVKKGREKGILR